MTTPADRAVTVVGLLSIAALLAGLAVAYMPSFDRIVAGASERRRRLGCYLGDVRSRRDAAGMLLPASARHDDSRRRAA